jgi:MFS transporter, DHA1 family, multidrug resistance protein
MPSATCGPSIGPLISSFSTVAEGWRWSQWELLWLSGPVLIFMFFLLPETSTETILLRRACRLRKSTGNANLMSQSEIDQANLSAKEVAFNALIKPVSSTRETELPVIQSAYLVRI